MNHIYIGNDLFWVQNINHHRILYDLMLSTSFIILFNIIYKLQTLLDTTLF